jgi:lysophospholipase L1-like esterase
MDGGVWHFRRGHQPASYAVVEGRIVTLVHVIATVLLGPVLLGQGRFVRRRLPLLPEPPGDRIGTAGNGPALRLLVIGDSAAAGVGAAHQNDALLGQIVARLSPHYTVHWTLHAQTGATTASTLEGLGQLGESSFDVVVTSLGVNDITASVGRSRWRMQQQELRNTLGRLFQPQLIVVSGFPPVHGFPALPQPLRWYLGRRAKELDRDLRQDVRDETRIKYVQINFTEDPLLMATDGFHPGPPAYALWGQRVADKTLRTLWPSSLNHGVVQLSGQS